MKINCKALWQFLRKHLPLEICILIGIAAGPSGLVAGCVAGFFIEIIISRVREEKSYRELVEKGGEAKSKVEPFPGAVYVCGLAVYCLGDYAAAAREIQLVFGKKYKTDWNTICRSASETVGLNGDLIVEYLAAILLKNMAQGNEKPVSEVPLVEIFRILQISEFNWDGEKGEKPSVYLARLLNWRCDSDELESAYSILGLTKNASIGEVKKAHRKLAAKYHPDTGEEANEAEFIRVQKAYELIAKNYHR